MAALDRQLKGTPYAVLDFETTGVRPRECWPVQWAVVHGVLGEDEPAPTVYGWGHVAPPADVEIPEEASRIHGIRRSDLADAPSLEEALPAILDALDGRLLVAFNLPYDFQVLATSCERTGRLPPLFVGLDPLVWARKAADKWSGQKLAEVAARYKVPAGEAHDARGDAMTTARVLRPLLKDFLLSLRDTWGERTWVERGVVRSLRAFVDAQADVGRAFENQMARWFRSKGKPFGGYPWHELTGHPLPLDLQAPRMTRCRACGAECEQSLDGSPVPLDPGIVTGVRFFDDGVGLDLRAYEPAALRLPEGGAVGVYLVPDDYPLREGDRRVSGRLNHWWTCPKSGANRNRRTA